MQMASLTDDSPGKRTGALKVGSLAFCTRGPISQIGIDFLLSAELAWVD